MGNKQYKKMRKALGIKKVASTNYRMESTAVKMPWGVHYKLTYVSIGPRAMYKIAKKIYDISGVLPKQNGKI